MTRFLGIIGGLLVLIFLCLSGFGFWHFVNSSAAEAQAWKIVDTLSGSVALLVQGIFILLILLGIGGFIWLGGRGVEPIARAAGTYMLSKKASRLMLPDSGVEMPDIRIWPPPKTQLAIPPDEIIGGDARLLIHDGQTQ